MEKKTFITIILSLLSVFILGLILCYLYKQESKITFTAVVKEVNTSNYLITPLSEDLPSLISVELDKNYNPGDIIEIIAHNEMLETYPVRMNVISHKLIQKNKITTSITNLIEENNNIEIEYAIISDFSNYISIINNENISPDSKKSAKKYIMTVIDFIFNNKEIAGFKFIDLSNKGKLKIIEIALELDNTINNKFPNYKNELESSYINIKGKLISLYLDKTNEFCQNNDLVCDDAKTNFQTLKKSLNITWSFITSITDKSRKELEAWYEIFSGK
ncbi:MAG: hypothetical protein PHG03_00810 [Bacilli bacterium]|nr:hypothetical protein [Bacilli bacterium]MDD4795086.1 hypothetical protein [Bacilli bacterium]